MSTTDSRPDDDSPTLLGLGSSDVLGPNAQAVARWYCVSREGMATLCKNHEDAQANARHCDKAWPAGGPHCAVLLVDATEIARLRHALAQSGKLAEDRLQQMKADRAQALRWRDALTELHDRIKAHPAYADLTEEEEIAEGGDTAELSFLARVADAALGA